MALGGRLAALLGVGDVVFLQGSLGAGKTTLARGVIQALAGADQEAPSPTYTLVQTYETPRGPLWHCDLFRLRAPGEAAELGLEEAFAEAIVLLEWPERLGGAAPSDRLEVSLAGASRAATLTGHGTWERRLHGL